MLENVCRDEYCILIIIDNNDSKTGSGLYIFLLKDFI